MLLRNWNRPAEPSLKIGQSAFAPIEFFPQYNNSLPLYAY